MSTNPISDARLAECQAELDKAQDGRNVLMLSCFRDASIALTELRDRRSADSRANQAVVDDQWRGLALQFDGHRIEALGHIRALLDGPGHEHEAREFLHRPPLSGEAVLSERLAALSRAEGQEPVAWARYADDGEMVEVFHNRKHYEAMVGLGKDVRPLYAAPGSALVKTPAPAVPDGWKLVPVEPIDEMLVPLARYTGDMTRHRTIYRAMLAAAPPPPVATHRHKKRGTEYVLLGIGKMQAEHWVDKKPSIEALMKEPPASVPPPSVDMRPIAIYQSTDDGSLWARPIEEWEDGRFEKIGGA